MASRVAVRKSCCEGHRRHSVTKLRCIHPGLQAGGYLHCFLSSLLSYGLDAIIKKTISDTLVCLLRRLRLV